MISSPVFIGLKSGSYPLPRCFHTLSLMESIYTICSSLVMSLFPACVLAKIVVLVPLKYEFPAKIGFRQEHYCGTAFFISAASFWSAGKEYILKVNGQPLLSHRPL